MVESGNLTECRSRLLLVRGDVFCSGILFFSFEGCLIGDYECWIERIVLKILGLLQSQSAFDFFET